MRKIGIYGTQMTLIVQMTTDFIKQIIKNLRKSI